MMNEMKEIQCRECGGNGHTMTISHVEPDGGISQDEWAEACYDDPDFQEDYFNGLYDKRVSCGTCGTTGKETVMKQTHCVVCEEPLSEEQLVSMKKNGYEYYQVGSYNGQPCWGDGKRNTLCMNELNGWIAEEAGQNCRCGNCAWCWS